jgi:hypothetical protein
MLIVVVVVKDRITTFHHPPHSHNHHTQTHHIYRHIQPPDRCAHLEEPLELEDGAPLSGLGRLRLPRVLERLARRLMTAKVRSKR